MLQMLHMHHEKALIFGHFSICQSWPARSISQPIQRIRTAALRAVPC